MRAAASSANGTPAATVSRITRRNGVTLFPGQPAPSSAVTSFQTQPRPAAQLTTHYPQLTAQNSSPSVDSKWPIRSAFAANVCPAKHLDLNCLTPLPQSLQ